LKVRLLLENAAKKVDESRANAAQIELR
jgi:hypothetical protein